MDVQQKVAWYLTGSMSQAEQVTGAARPGTDEDGGLATLRAWQDAGAPTSPQRSALFHALQGMSVEARGVAALHRVTGTGAWDLADLTELPLAVCRSAVAAVRDLPDDPPGAPDPAAEAHDVAEDPDVAGTPAPETLTPERAPEAAPPEQPAPAIDSERPATRRHRAADEPTPQRSTPWIPVVAGLLALALVGGGAWYLTRPETKDTVVTPSASPSSATSSATFDPQPTELPGGEQVQLPPVPLASSEPANFWLEGGDLLVVTKTDPKATLTATYSPMGGSVAPVALQDATTPWRRWRSTPARTG